MEAMIEVRKLCKSFVVNKKQNHVLRNVNLSIYKGEFIAVMGPSGSGKSTLLYTISGMDHINSGTVEFDHKEISRYNEMEMAKLRLHEMGFIFQQMHFLNNLNIYDNVILPGYMAKKRKHKEINAYADELLRNYFNCRTQHSGSKRRRAAACLYRQSNDQSAADSVCG